MQQLDTYGYWEGMAYEEAARDDAIEDARADRMPYTGDHIHSCRSNYGSDFELVAEGYTLGVLVDTLDDAPQWRLMRATKDDQCAGDEQLARLATEHCAAINERAKAYAKANR